MEKMTPVLSYRTWSVFTDKDVSQMTHCRQSKQVPRPWSLGLWRVFPPSLRSQVRRPRWKKKLLSVCFLISMFKSLVFLPSCRAEAALWHTWTLLCWTQISGRFCHVQEGCLLSNELQINSEQYFTFLLSSSVSCCHTLVCSKAFESWGSDNVIFSMNYLWKSDTI